MPKRIGNARFRPPAWPQVGSTDRANVNTNMEQEGDRVSKKPLFILTGILTLTLGVFSARADETTAESALVTGPSARVYALLTYDEDAERVFKYRFLFPPNPNIYDLRDKYENFSLF